MLPSVNNCCNECLSGCDRAFAAEIRWWEERGAMTRIRRLILRMLWEVNPGQPSGETHCCKMSMKSCCQNFQGNLSYLVILRNQVSFRSIEKEIGWQICWTNETSGKAPVNLHVIFSIGECAKPGKKVFIRFLLSFSRDSKQCLEHVDCRRIIRVRQNRHIRPGEADRGLHPEPRAKQTTSPQHHQMDHQVRRGGGGWSESDLYQWSWQLLWCPGRSWRQQSCNCLERSLSKKPGVYERTAAVDSEWWRLRLRSDTLVLGEGQICPTDTDI